MKSNEWYLFEIEIDAILEYLERKSGSRYTGNLACSQESNKWHMAIREGTRHHLHLNVGIPGIESPDNPIEENESAIFAALILGKSRLQVILSGEWEVAVQEGLISRNQLVEHEHALSEAIACAG